MKKRWVKCIIPKLFLEFGENTLSCMGKNEHSLQNG